MAAILELRRDTSRMGSHLARDTSERASL